MDELRNYRDMIDRLDKDLVSLFIERMNVVTMIAEYKKKSGVPVFDQEREKAVIGKVKGYTAEESMKEPVARLFTSIMEISKDIQTEKNK